MTSKIILKKSSVVGKVPLPTDLEYGELALNYTDKKLFLKDSTNNIAEIGGGVTSFNTRAGAVTLTSGDVTTALSYTPVNKAGDTMSGALALGGNKITGLADPTAAQDAATKAYVDNALGDIQAALDAINGV